MPAHRRPRRLYLEPSDFVTDTVELTGAQALRLVSVLRLRPGALVSVFDGLGHERTASLVEASRGRVVLALGAAAQALPEPQVPVVVCCAFPRGARGDWLVEKATELGAASFVPIESDRAVMRAGDGRVDRWRRIAVEAAEQCGRAVVPTFEDTAPAHALHLVADFDGLAAPADAIAGVPLPTALALHVGPEGGWTPEERAAQAAAGYVRVGLGPRVLRVETAVIALLTLTVEALRTR